MSGVRSERPDRGRAAARSGLRNPAAAVRGVGGGALAAEGLVLLLAILPMRVLGGERHRPGHRRGHRIGRHLLVLAGLLRSAGPGTRPLRCRWPCSPAASSSGSLGRAGCPLRTRLALRPARPAPRAALMIGAVVSGGCAIA